MNKFIFLCFKKQNFTRARAIFLTDKIQIKASPHKVKENNSSYKYLIHDGKGP
jgi:hypothetical protein